MPEGIYTSNITGTRGEITIPALGILVARLERPQLIRRPPGDDTLLVGQFDLQAAYSFLNVSLFEDDDFSKLWKIWIGKKPLEVTLVESSKIENIGHAKVLRVEGVNAEWLHE